MYEQQPTMQQPAMQQTFAQPAGPHPYKKMGGWLLFLVIMAILGVVFKVIGLLGADGVVNTVRSVTEGLWRPLADNLLNLALLAVSVVFVVMAFKRDPRFLLFWQFGWIASLVKRLLFAGDLISGTAGASADEFLQALEASGQGYRLEQLEEIMAQTGLTMEMFMSIIVGVMIAVGIFAIVGCFLRFLFVTLYYRRSVRTRTYMGSGEYLRLAVCTRKANVQPAVPDEAAPEIIPTTQETSL